MKTLLALLILIPSFSWGEQLEPMGKLFKELLEEGIEIDENTAEYFTYRCTGLFIAIGGTSRKTEKEISTIYNNHSKKLLEMLYKERFKLSKDKQKSQEFVLDRASKISDAYIEAMEDNWVTRGTYIAGSFIEDELKACQDFTVKLYKNSEDD